MVLGAKSPRRLLGLPAAAWRLYREDKSAPKAAAPAVPALAPAELVRLHAAGGADGVIAGVLARAGGDAKAGGAALLEAGRTLTQEGIAAAELPLAQHAARIDGTESTLRALHWVAQRAGDLMTARACTREIERIYGPRPGPVQIGLLEKLHRSPAHQLSVLEGVAPPGPPRIAPVPGRLVYVLHNSLPYSSGGYATRAHGLALGLAAAGLDVVCLTRPGFPLDIKHDLDPAGVPPRDTVDGIDYHRLATPRRTDGPVRDYMLAAAEAFVPALERLRPEWVIAATNHVTALPALIAALPAWHPLRLRGAGLLGDHPAVARTGVRPELGLQIQVILEAEAANAADAVFTLTTPMRTSCCRSVA